MDSTESSDPLAFCRPHCKPEVIRMLEQMCVDVEYRVILTVLQECHVHHKAFLMIIAELNDVSSSQSALASLLNEVRQYHQVSYRVDIAKYIAERGEESETHAHLLAQWLELYQMWSRTIT